ncbi:MAG: NADP-dependent malic enzyme [Xanthomonadales bacterium]|nr:NADP-dependent malic enzyme [Xanthomonadales bacterium]NNL94456.1 NADP-dependent malic enzyme [Xanthomonadales bacterium]
MTDKLKESALEYHRYPVPGKIRITPTKALTTQQDLALAYSPGVAAASELIHKDPLEVSNLTVRGNLVAVITNGTAVLGLGNIGPLAAKPVMEGKGVLFKKFADIDVFDIEIEEPDPDKLIEIIASLEPTFGGINLEDIKAPECFRVEAELKDRMNIPVFHDDQHGTAIITAAAMINALEVVGKDISQVQLVTSGAGAAGMACLDLLVNLGLNKEHVTVCDSKGVVYQGRKEYMDDRKAGYARDTKDRSLADAVDGADVFLGVSVGGVLTQEMVKTMADRPIILALANPTPEIMPDEALAARPDALIATGRSDFPNQVNNVLCFPYIFRGALDVGATTINAEMQMACVHAIAELARMEVSDVSAAAYGDKPLQFGPEYLIPKPFDPRLLVQVASATAEAAMKSGVATRPLGELGVYREKLRQFLFRTGLLMKPVFDAARRDVKRVVFSEGEEEVVLRAVQSVVDDELAEPVLVGRPSVVLDRIEKLGLRIKPDQDFELVNPESDPRFWNYWTTYHALMERHGVSPATAKAIVRTQDAVIAALMVHLGEADALITGMVGRFHKKLAAVMEVIGIREGGKVLGTLGVLNTADGVYFVCDTHVNADPTAEEIAEITMMAAETVRIFGIEPRIALVSHSSFGSHIDRSASKMKMALELIHIADPSLEVEGEMSADMALNPDYRKKVFPNSKLQGPANLMVMPDLDSAHIAFNLSRVVSKGVTVGPILMGARKPVHVLSPSATVRRIVNMTAIAAVDAQIREVKSREKNL